jgi:hypothetical protein
MKVAILQIGGHAASIGVEGSMIDRDIDQMQKRYPKLAGAIEHIELSADRRSIKRSIKFLKENMNLDTNLIIVGKSLGCVRLNSIIKKASKTIIGYNHIDILTVDGNGALWYGWYGWYGKFFGVEFSRKFPATEMSKTTKCSHVNFYQRNKSLYGAIWKGAENICLTEFADGTKVNHWNILNHPMVASQLDWIAEHADC